MVDDTATFFAAAKRHLSCSAAKPKTANPHKPRAIMTPTWQCLLQRSKCLQAQQTGEGRRQIKPGTRATSGLFQV